LLTYAFNFKYFFATNCFSFPQRHFPQSFSFPQAFIFSTIYRTIIALTAFVSASTFAFISNLLHTMIAFFPPKHFPQSFSFPSKHFP